MSGTLNITYSLQYPILTWTPMVPYPTSYSVQWSTAPSGATWVTLNQSALSVTQYQDDEHKLNSERRIYYRVLAFVGAVSAVHAGPVVYKPTVRGKFQYIGREIKRRHNLMLTEFSAEYCDVFLRKAAGVPCNACGKRAGDGIRQGYEGELCPVCYNTCIVGGYTKLNDVPIRVRSAQDMIEQTPEGFKISDGRNAWISDYPVMDVGDFFERPNGERFSVINARKREIQGENTFQMLSIQQIEPEFPLQQVSI